MGEASLGAAVAARVPGVLGLGQSTGRRLPPAPGPEPARRLAVPAGGRSAPALLRRDLVALRVGFLLERGDRDLRCRSEAGLLCRAERGVHVRVARGDLIAGVFCGRPSARVLNLLRGVEALLLGGRDATSGASGGGRRRVDDDVEVLELPHALRAAAATTSTTRSAERRPIMPPSSRKPSRTGERPAGPLRSHSGLRTRAGSVLVIDVDDLGAVRGRGPHTELGLSLLRCPADETRQASRPPSGSSDPRCCDEKGVTACAGRSDARIARIPHRPTERSASTARVGAGMRAGNGADLVDLEQPPGSISPRGGHERRAAGATATARG